MPFQAASVTLAPLQFWAAPHFVRESKREKKMHSSRYSLLRKVLKLGVLAVLTVGNLGLGNLGVANPVVQAAQLVADASVASNVIALRDLPVQGQKTYRLILQGGPFPYNKDGTVFGNRERLLPMRPRGYYREYTVQTPAARGRGAKRIVCGGPATAPETCFYTTDHYASFRTIVP